MKKIPSELEILDLRLRNIQQSGSPLLQKLSTLEVDFHNLTARLLAAGLSGEDTVSILRDICKNILERRALLKTHGEHIGQMGDVLQQYAQAVRNLIKVGLQSSNKAPVGNGG